MSPIAHEVRGDNPRLRHGYSQEESGGRTGVDSFTDLLLARRGQKSQVIFLLTDGSTTALEPAGRPFALTWADLIDTPSCSLVESAQFTKVDREGYTVTYEFHDSSGGLASTAWKPSDLFGLCPAGVVASTVRRSTAPVYEHPVEDMAPYIPPLVSYEARVRIETVELGAPMLFPEDLYEVAQEDMLGADE